MNESNGELFREGLLLRPYEHKDQKAVRTLFKRVNRDLAPAHMKQAFEAYVELSLKEEIDIIPQYYNAERGRSFRVAVKGTSVCGFFGLEPTGDSTIELRRMYVDPSYRRRGVARWMLDQAERISRQEGWTKMVLSTSELQSAAVMFYRSTHFTLVRDELVSTTTNKTVGRGIRRLYFEKSLI